MKLKFVKSPLRSSRGFTLIELMIVVTVIGILIGIAVPTYQDSVRKSRRGQAKADLVQLAQGMERFYTSNNGSYAGATLVKMGWPNAQSPKEGAPRYNLSFVGTPDSSTFTLRAVPIPGNAQAKDKCGTLTINNLGQKTPGKLPEETAECWNMN